MLLGHELLHTVQGLAVGLELFLLLLIAHKDLLALVDVDDARGHGAGHLRRCVQEGRDVEMGDSCAGELGSISEAAGQDARNPSDCQRGSGSDGGVVGDHDAVSADGDGAAGR